MADSYGRLTSISYISPQNTCIFDPIYHYLHHDIQYGTVNETDTTCALPTEGVIVTVAV